MKVLSLKALFGNRRFWLLSTTAMILAATLWTVYESQKTQYVKVEWIKESAPEPSGVVALPSKKSGRSIASIGPRLVMDEGKEKLEIQVHFVCSSWLYLATQSLDDPNTINADYCRSFVAEQMEVAQHVFRNSNIPVFFTWDWEVEPARFTNIGGTYSSAAAVQAATASINNSDLSIPNFMPAVQFSDISPILTYVAPYRYVYNGNGKNVMPGLLADKYFRPNPCRDPNSLVNATNFEITWGIKPLQMATIMLPDPEGKVGPSSMCGGHAGCPVNRIKINQGDAFKTNYGCAISCSCYHSMQYADARTFESFGCGKWPGKSSDLSPYNACGFFIEQSVARWDASADTKYRLRTASLLTTVPVDTTAKWIYRHKNTQNYIAKANNYQITIFVRPFSDQSTTFTTLGRAAGIADLSSGYYFNATTGGDVVETRGIPAPADFFSTMGWAIVNRDTPKNTTVAHEIGHILGGFHEVEFMRNQPTSSVFHADALTKRQLGAYSNAPQGYATVMTASGHFPINYFSSPDVKSQSYTLSSGVEDNRRNIVRTVSYLAGKKMEIYPTPEVKSILTNILNFILGE